LDTLPSIQEYDRVGLPTVGSRNLRSSVAEVQKIPIIYDNAPLPIAGSSPSTRGLGVSSLATDG
jgi:hypothetical protein